MPRITKAEKIATIGKEMEHIANEGFKTLKIPFTAKLYTGQLDINHIDGYSEFHYDIISNVSVGDNFANFSKKLNKEYIGKDSIAMKNFGSKRYLGSYLYQSLEACANFANGDKKAFTKAREQWKSMLNSDIKHELRKYSGIFQSIGFSNNDIVKALNANVKEVKNEIYEQKHSMSIYN